MEAASAAQSIFSPNDWLACKLAFVLISFILDIFLAVIVCLYLVQLAYIYRRKDHVAVQTRSPLILLVGGVSLLLDSCINFAI